MSSLTSTLEPTFELASEPGMSSIVDIHPHIVSPDTKKYPLDPLGGTQSTWSTERPTTYDDLLRAMDDAGVAKAAIVHSSTAYGYDNSYVADAVKAFGTVDILVSNAGIQIVYPIEEFPFASWKKMNRARS